MFKAIYIDKVSDNDQTQLATLTEADLPSGEVLVAVEYSSLNYKDALAITGKSPVVRNFPMVAGIDCAGTVLRSETTRFQAGDKVLLNGFGCGEKFWGGLAQKACFNADWLIKLPEQLTTYQAMAIGTAGYTAMLCILALQKQGIRPEHGKVLVTGATGGVGSFAIALLAQLGYQVIGSTGKINQHEYLHQLGALEIIDRCELAEKGKPLMKERWIAAIDCVGGQTLANVCASTAYGGVVTSCGLAQSMDFPATVAPFILRGVRLIGIDSVMCPISIRIEAWQQLAQLITPELLGQISQQISLEQVINYAPCLLRGEIKGRLVVKM